MKSLVLSKHPGTDEIGSVRESLIDFIQCRLSWANIISHQEDTCTIRELDTYELPEEDQSPLRTCLTKDDSNYLYYYKFLSS